MTTPVDELAQRRARKVPAWNPDTRRHAWEDIPGEPCAACGSTPETEHRCLHCEIVVHSAQEGGVWVQHFAAPQPDGSTRHGRMASKGKCPGPRRHLEIVPPPAAPEQPQGHPCCRCNPPCGRPTRQTQHGYVCAPAHAAINERAACELERLRAATSGLGVLIKRGEVA